MFCPPRFPCACPEPSRGAAASGAALRARRGARALLSTFVVLAALAPDARAADPPSRDERAAAVALFDEGRALMAAGKHAEACPKLAESQRIDPGIGTLFNLSDCYERIGRTATAWIGFRDVAAAALAAGQMERERVARARAAALEPRLSRLQIVVPQETAVEGIELTRSGVIVGRALWGTAVPLDPGEHRIAAAAPGYKTWESKVVLEKPGVVSIQVPPLARDPGAAAASTEAPKPPAEQPPADRPKPPPPPPPQAKGGGLQRPLGMVAVGLGVAGLGAGTVLGFMAKSTFDEANEKGECDDAGNCKNAIGITMRDDAVTQGNIGTAVFIAGAVLAAGGAVLWLTAPSSSDVAETASARGRGDARTAPWQARVGLGPGNVWIEGKF
ncbi:hypothetical protein [Sorangium sp. So ce131]|uniref:hypothetical protein n=1 Tax=Sorangium sp. So ce131 TaxID=3133282 RepID=UPI003F5F1DA7